MQNGRYLTKRELADAGVPFSHFTAIRLEKKGQFPKRAEMSPGKLVWLRDEVDAWLAERIQARGQKAAA